MGKFFAGLLRFILGAGLIAVFAFVAFSLLEPFQPAPGPGSFPFATPLEALACIAIAGYGLALALSRSPWRRVLWAVRVALIALGVMVVAYWQAAVSPQRIVPVGLIVGGMFVVGLILHHVAHRHALGWIIDDNGERQKVDHWIRGRAVFNATTRDQRMIQEAYQKSNRRKALFGSLLCAAPIGYGAYWLYKPDHWFAAAVVAVFAGGFLLLGVLPNLIGEILYQLGYQDMEGAKVLDPEVYRPGLREIIEQMAHGSASEADEAEAQGFLNRRR